MRRRALVPLVAAVAVACAGGTWAMTRDDEGLGFDASVASYDGPLDADGRFGSAGLALDCVHDDAVVGSRFRGEVYQDGATADDPERAVELAYSEGLFLSSPSVELGTAATGDDRQLLTYEHDGTVLMALLVRNGPATQGAGGDGWYVEAHARCDFSEFPEETARTAFGTYGVWTDADGTPVPVAKVYSAPGPEHCDWQRMTFLHLDDPTRRARSYVEDPERDLLDVVAGPYLDDVPLPADARDTGWEREGRHLWLSADGRYAYVGSAGSVDGWPRFESGCE